MGGPLEGIVVVDTSRSTAGWRMTQLFADYGADVVWVEPRGGDPRRAELAIEHAVFNRGKHSIELDLDLDGEQVRDLLGGADLFVETGRPGEAEALGLGWADVHRFAPALVYCSISGFGSDGEWRDVPGYEALVHAAVGTMAEQIGMRPAPIFEGLPFGSIGAAYLGAAGALAALYRRNIDGRGRRVETSLLDGALAYLMMMWGDSDRGPTMHIPGEFRLVARTFLCSDGEYLGVHTGAVGAFERLMEVLGLADEFAVDPSQAGMGTMLTETQVALVADEIPRLFEKAPRADWLRRLREADVCAVEILRPGEVFDEPQVRHNQMVVEVDDPVLGVLEQVAPPAKFSMSQVSSPSAAPAVGQNSSMLAIGRRPAAGAGPDDGADVALLDGVRVLDLGAFYAGPYTSRLLADLGADVIKLETVAGDPLRGLTLPFRSAQAGKRAIALDLKDPQLAPAREHLLRWADVVHHNMRPGAAERLGMGYDDVRAIHPDVVYLYAPGWGATGPDSARQSFAPKMSGYVGAGFEVAGRFNPPLFPVGNEDPGNGMVGAVATLMALLCRQRTGLGQYVENPQLNATMMHVAHIVRHADGEVLGADRLDPMQLGFSAFERLYQTRDGWLCLVAGTDAELIALSGVVPGLFDAPAAITRESRIEHDDLLAIRLEQAFDSDSTDAWIAKLAAAGVPVMVPKAERNSIPFLRDPEQHRIGRVAEGWHERDGVVREIDQLVRVSGAATVPHRIAPELGAHTNEILRDIGYSDEQIAALRERGAAR
jgi:crotonobetainyl-CoA:carnitine CoA-transferase CaiB-like acyl-CoA transferase